MARINCVKCEICDGNHSTEACGHIKEAITVADTEVYTRARQTLPRNLELVTLSDGSTAVKTREYLKKSTMFGPFQSKKLTFLKKIITFPIKVFFPDATFLYLDTSDENECNWMCLIQGSVKGFSKAHEQNLICFQLGTEIYYMTFREIYQGEFLKVGYSRAYGAKMGFKSQLCMAQMSTDHILHEFQEQENKAANQLVSRLPNATLGVPRSTAVAEWRCRNCGITDFPSVVAYAKHMIKHYADDPEAKKVKRIKASLELNESSYSEQEINDLIMANMPAFHKTNFRMVINDYESETGNFYKSEATGLLGESNEALDIAIRRGLEANSINCDNVNVSQEECNSVVSDILPDLSEDFRGLLNDLQGYGEENSPRQVNVADYLINPSENFKNFEGRFSDDEFYRLGEKNAELVNCFEIEKDSEELDFISEFALGSSLQNMELYTTANLLNDIENSLPTELGLDTKEIKHENSIPLSGGFVNSIPTHIGLENSISTHIGLENSISTQIGLENSISTQLLLENSIPTQLGLEIPTQLGLKDSIPTQLGLENSLPISLVLENSLQSELNLPIEMETLEQDLARRIKEALSDQTSPRKSEEQLLEKFEIIVPEFGEMLPITIEPLFETEMNVDQSLPMEVEQLQMEAEPVAMEAEPIAMEAEPVAMVIAVPNEETLGRTTCTICRRKLASLNGLKKHMMRHTGDFTCTVCKKAFVCKQSLTKHLCTKLVKSTDGLVKRCELCSMEFSPRDAKALWRHLRSVHQGQQQCKKCNKWSAKGEQHSCMPKVKMPGGAVSCPVCPKVFKQSQYLERHMKTHAATVQCSVCDKKVRGPHALQHLAVCAEARQLHTAGVAKCPTCYEMFVETREFRDHVAAHSHPFPCPGCGARLETIEKREKHKCMAFQCELCLEKFDMFCSYRSHLAGHGEAEYHCFECALSFHLESSLAMHPCDKRGFGEPAGEPEEFAAAAVAVNNNNNNGGDLVCEVCALTYNTLRALKAHVAMMHEDPKYACEEEGCGKIFYRKALLQTHASVHSSIEFHICPKPNCTTVCKTTKILSKHLRSHREASHVCPDCDQGFFLRRDLNKHRIETHKQGGNFCRECNEPRGETKEEIHFHVLQHEQDRPLPCMQCPRRFKTGEQLRYHNKVKHSEKKKFPCTYCPKSFLTKSSLKRHSNNLHKDLQPPNTDEASSSVPEPSSGTSDGSNDSNPKTPAIVEPSAFDLLFSSADGSGGADSASPDAKEEPGLPRASVKQKDPVSDSASPDAEEEPGLPRASVKRKDPVSDSASPDAEEELGLPHASVKQKDPVSDSASPDAEEEPGLPRASVKQKDPVSDSASPDAEEEPGLPRASVKRKDPVSDSASPDTEEEPGLPRASVKRKGKIKVSYVKPKPNAKTIVVKLHDLKLKYDKSTATTVNKVKGSEANGTGESGVETSGGADGQPKRNNKAAGVFACLYCPTVLKYAASIRRHSLNKHPEKSQQI